MFSTLMILSIFTSKILVCRLLFMFFFFFKQKTAYEMRISDWSSDVCSSDLFAGLEHRPEVVGGVRPAAVRARHCGNQPLRGPFRVLGNAVAVAVGLAELVGGFRDAGLREGAVAVDGILVVFRIVGGASFLVVGLVGVVHLVIGGSREPRRRIGLLVGDRTDRLLRAACRPEGDGGPRGKDQRDAARASCRERVCQYG